MVIAKSNEDEMKNTPKSPRPKSKVRKNKRGKTSSKRSSGHFKIVEAENPVGSTVKVINIEYPEDERLSTEYDRDSNFKSFKYFSGFNTANSSPSSFQSDANSEKSQSIGSTSHIRFTSKFGKQPKSKKRKVKKSKSSLELGGNTSLSPSSSSTNSNITIRRTKATAKPEDRALTPGNSFHFEHYLPSEESDIDEFRLQANASRTEDFRLTLDGFLTFFRDLPNLDELSVTSLNNDAHLEEKASIKNVGSGKSVHSKTGIPFTDSSTDLDGVDPEQLAYEFENTYPEENKLKRPSLLTFSSSEIEPHDDALFNLDRSDIDVGEVKAKEVADISLDDQLNKALGDAQRLQFLETHNILEKNVAEFLDGLLKKVVSISEKTPQLSKKLDSDKLYKQLKQEIANYNEESTFNRLLIKHITDLIVRRGNYSQVKPIEDHKYRNYVEHRYKVALNQVDYWLRRESEAKEVRNAEVDSLIEEERLKTLQANEIVKRLEDLVANTVLQWFDRSDRLRQLISDLLIKMDKMRDQISMERHRLILEQNRFANIKAKSDEVDTIGEGLKMRQYLSVQEDVNRLTRKIEARNNELRRLHSSLHSHIHSICHMRCRGKLLRSNLLKSNVTLKSKVSQWNELREQIYSDNQSHNRIYKEIELVKHQSGIMHYPLLMTDYDKTVESLNAKRSQVNELKMQYQKLLEKVGQVEENNRQRSENEFD